MLVTQHTQAPLLSNRISVIHGSRINYETICCPQFCTYSYQILCHDTKFGNSRCEIVGRRVIFIWSLIHGLRWSGLIKAEPAYHSIEIWAMLRYRVTLTAKRIALLAIDWQWPWWDSQAIRNDTLCWNSIRTLSILLELCAQDSLMEIGMLRRLVI